MSADAALPLRLAARAMARHGLVHAYGHVSLRAGEGLLVSPARPLGTVEVGEPGLAAPLEGALPAGVLQEVRIHQAIYRARPEIGAICRVQPPALMALSALGRTPRALHGLGAYFAPAPPLWDDVALVRDDARAQGVAAALGDGRAVVLRGNGAVVVGETMAQAASHAFFLEDAARLELALLTAAGEARPYTPEAAVARATGAGGLYERMWMFLCFGDPEWQAQT